MEWSGFGIFQIYPLTITILTGLTMNLQLRTVHWCLSMQDLKVENGGRSVVMETTIQFARNLFHCQLRPKQLPHLQARVAKRNFERKGTNTTSNIYYEKIYFEVFSEF